MKKSAIVIGAGIVGLATARALGARGYRVTVFERDEKAVGASIRNFGMVWPIGQPVGKLYDRAMKSRGFWKELLGGAGLWFEETGSLHVVYEEDELTFAEELAAQRNDPNIAVLTPQQTLARSPAVNPDGLRGSLWSATEVIVDPRQAIAALPKILSARYDISFHWRTVINRISYPAVFSGSRQWEADEIYVCSGQDFETLYPDTYREAPITKCKLQMMRVESQPDAWRIGPALCGALSFIHYESFKAPTSHAALKKRLQDEYPEYVRWGIHVMAAQNGLGEITLGDSHEYGLSFDPFDKAFINDLVLTYLARFARFKSMKLSQSWNGIYAKMLNGATEIVLNPEPGVTVINGLGGNGMTLSFGLCEEIISGQYS